MKNATPQQVFLVLQMFFGTNGKERERRFGDVKPAIRQALIEQKILRVDTRGRAKYLLLGDEANEFVMKHLGAPVPARAYAGKVLEAVLGKVREFLQTEGHSLEEMFGRSSAPVLHPPPGVSDPVQAVREAYLGLTRGEKRCRVRLADLRAKVGVPRPVLDATLLAMQNDRQLVLYKLDNPAEVSDADRESAVYIVDEPRHVVYLET